MHPTKPFRQKFLSHSASVQGGSCNFFFFFNFLFIYLFLAVLGLRFVRGLSLVAASGGHSSSRCAGLSLSWPLLLRSTGSRRAGSVVVAHGPSCSAACRIFPDQGSNPCALHWQADSQPLRHQGSPAIFIFWKFPHISHIHLQSQLSRKQCWNFSENTLKGSFWRWKLKSCFDVTSGSQQFMTLGHSRAP